ncbi:MAG: membrane protein insertion efficiency factor YidD [Parachlamydiaceae bacterium]
MKYLFIGFIRLYQLCIRPFLGAEQLCRFTPSCSHYAMQALKKHGIFKGSWLAIKRLSKCGPWHRGGPDSVP